MKVVLKDIDGREVELPFTSTDSFSDIVNRAAFEQGLDIDVRQLQVDTSVNVLEYVSAENENVDSGASCWNLRPQTDVLGNLCRLCAQQTPPDELQSVLNFREQLSYLRLAKVSANDKLSKQVCSFCVSQLRSYQSFASACFDAEKRQWELLNQVRSLENSGSKDNEENKEDTQSENSAAVEVSPLPLDDPYKKRRGTYHCNDCQKVFHCKKRLIFHLKLHDGPPGCCPVCNKKLLTELCLYKHYVYNHAKRRTHCCHVCGRAFRNKSSLTYHSRAHLSFEAMRPYSCHLCDRRFARKNTLRDHISSRHGGDAAATVYLCNCQEVFPSAAAVSSHAAIHHSDVEGTSYTTKKVNKLFVCEFCDKCFCEEKTLSGHRAGHGPPDPFQCKFCNEDLPTDVALAEHLDSHVADGMLEYKTEFQVPTLYVCGFCEERFRCYESFDHHRASHPEDSSYSCKFCLASFTQIEEAIRHRSSHGEASGSTTPSNLPVCSWCGKSFSSQGILTRHVRTHTGERPYCCQVCGRAFSQRSGLNTHLKTHSDERPYECDICHERFKMVGSYKSHLRRHSGLKTFVCSTCDKAFGSQQILSQHQKTHLERKHLQCDLCQLHFTRICNLNLHRAQCEGKLLN